MLRLWRSLPALAVLLVPPGLLVMVGWYLYHLPRLALPIVYIVVALLWAEVLRGLRSR